MRNIFIDKFYYCPHLLDGKIAKYKKKCDCRKPGNKLFKQAITDLFIDTANSIVIGDNITDIIPAFELGVCKGYLLHNNPNFNSLRSKYPKKKIITVNNWDGILKNYE